MTDTKKTRQSQIEAVKRNRRKMRESGKLKTVSLEFREHEMDLFEHVKENGPCATYIKKLIREDMERNQK